MNRSLTTAERARLEREAFRRTHRDFKGRFEGKPSVLVQGPHGTTLATLADMSDARLLEYARSHRVALPSEETMTPKQAVAKVRHYVKARGYPKMLGTPVPGPGGNWHVGVRTPEGVDKVIFVPHADIERASQERRAGARGAPRTERRCPLCEHTDKHDRKRGCLHFDGRQFCPCKG